MAIVKVSALLVCLIALIVTCFNDEQWLNRTAVSQCLASAIIFLTMIYAEYLGYFIVSLAIDKRNNDQAQKQHQQYHQQSACWTRFRPIFYLILSNEVLLPFPRRLFSISCTTIVMLLEMLFMFYFAEQNCSMIVHFSTFINAQAQLVTNWGHKILPMLFDMIFYILASLVAAYVTYLLEIVNRRTFLDHRKCVESKYKLTFEKDEQERLLSSCLPQHLMRKVRDDIRLRYISQSQCTLRINSDVRSCTNSFNTTNFTNQNQAIMKSGSKGSIGRPFSEMYIDKYSNVTILYADIVNSMVLTQTLQSPKILVETLNNLFCRFDSRAEVIILANLYFNSNIIYCRFTIVFELKFWAIVIIVFLVYLNRVFVMLKIA